jgi:hypothetical protein
LAVHPQAAKNHHSQLPPGKNGSVFLFSWGQVGTLEDLVISLTTEHQIGHMNDIKALLGPVNSNNGLEDSDADLEAA